MLKKKAYTNCVLRLFKGQIDKLHIIIERRIHFEVMKWFQLSDGQDAEVQNVSAGYKLDCNK